MARLVVDMKFWRRFVLDVPKISMNFLLARLPENKNTLFSDACTRFGMAGVVVIDPIERSRQGLDGLVWQISWEEWHRTAPLKQLSPRSVNIHVAEFLAALITCETFVTHCKSTLTWLAVDNYAAKG